MGSTFLSPLIPQIPPKIVEHRHIFLHLSMLATLARRTTMRASALQQARRSMSLKFSKVQLLSAPPLSAAVGCLIVPISMPLHAGP